MAGFLFERGLCVVTFEQAIDYRYISGSGNYRRLPKDAEEYRNIPKAGLKIEYRPNSVV